MNKVKAYRKPKSKNNEIRTNEGDIRNIVGRVSGTSIVIRKNLLIQFSLVKKIIIILTN